MTFTPPPASSDPSNQGTKYYCIEEAATMGWDLVTGCTDLTKDQAQTKFDQLVAEGANPNHIRIRIECIK
jgi:hypothetical protein